MLKTMDIMKEKEFPIAGCQSFRSAFNGYAVNDASLPTITSAKTAPNYSPPGCLSSFDRVKQQAEHA